MAAEKIYKCAFTNCIHESRDIPQDQAVKMSTRYMHKDCAEISRNTIKVRDLYYEKISNTVVVSQLMKVINNLVFSKNVNSEYLVFALTYAIKNSIPLRSPYGLYYLVDNQKIKGAWSKKQSEKIAEEIRTSANKDINIDPKGCSFSYKNSPMAGFGSILGGDK